MDDLGVPHLRKPPYIYNIGTWIMKLIVILSLIWYTKKNIVLGCMYIICIYLIEMLHIYKLDPLTWRLGGLLFATQRSMHVHVHALKTLVPIAFLSPSVLLSFLQHRLLTSVKFLARDIAVSINSSLTALVP